MTAHATNPRTRRPVADGGFTLIELIAVMIVTAILAAVAVPSMASLDGTRQSMARKQIRRDLAFAKQYAIATGTITWVEFDIVAESYTILAEDPSNLGKANAIVVTDPATGKPFTQVLDTGDLIGVEILTASFDGGTDVGFDWLGRPLNDTEAEFTGAWGVITITGGTAVSVSKTTGAFLES